MDTLHRENSSLEKNRFCRQARDVSKCRSSPVHTCFTHESNNPQKLVCFRSTWSYFSGSEHAWATPAERLMRSISIGAPGTGSQAQGAVWLVSTRWSWCRVFLPFRSMILAISHHQLRKFSLDTFLPVSSFSPRCRYLPSSILGNTVRGVGPMEKTKCLALSSKFNSRDVPTYLSMLFSILEVK